ncbi:hypothetical protein Ddye_030363 [Dipteronia dyeriana]|uniref:Reverse transcriptase zinc-binding domain-containing protein n=1 Tax=Dipteronia dyeriana TaxID=168575 RepID=A0AAD9TGY6_9ROSI|nr:hypothetical protein Ddye_030363 [Dipteronia dyeriana]
MSRGWVFEIFLSLTRHCWQCWRLVCHPNTLAAKVLKQCYFPDNSVLQAECKSSCSFLWKSFIWRIELLEARSRWRLGNGASVSIYKDRWIPRPITFKVISPTVLGESASVQMLKTVTGSWNLELVKETFMKEDVDLILSLPCSSSNVIDSFMWHYDKLGTFSMKSAYHIGCNLASNSSLSGLNLSNSWWKFLWRIKVSSKVKLLVWRACHNWIPSNVNLAMRGMKVDCSCPFCSTKPESTIHALWFCPTLKKVQTMCSFLRNLKYIRNGLVHASNSIHAVDIIPWADSSLEDLKRVNFPLVIDYGAHRLRGISQRPPDVRQFKMNLDAGNDVVKRKAGIGLIVRDCSGDVLASCALSVMGGFSLAVAEATTIRRGISFACEVGLFPCTIESDAQLVMNLINSNSFPLSEIGLVISDICKFLVDYPSCTIVYTPREANVAAHTLAKMGLKSSSDHYWMEDVPPCVAPVVMGDCPS